MAHVGLANCYFETNDTRHAVDHAQAAVKLDPTYARAWLLLGSIYQSQNKRASARQAYEKYLKLAPNGEFAHDVRVILTKVLRR